MQYEIRKVYEKDELYHHGILGQKWGIRRYQYKDGSLTNEGRKRYGSLRENISKWFANGKEKKKAQQEAVEEKKKVQQEKAKEKEEANKRKLIEFGSIDDINKNLKNFTPSEMIEIRNRFSTELQVREQINKLASMNEPVSSIAGKKNKTPMSSKVTAGTKYISDNISNLSQAATQANMFYNQVTKASNALLGTTNPLIV